MRLSSTMRRLPSLVFLFFIGISTSMIKIASDAGNPEIIPPFADGVSGSGYGCDRTCDGGDVNYVIRASLETYEIKGTGKAGFETEGIDVSAFTRTFTGIADKSSPFCNGGDDGTTGPLGPCMTVNPGQKLYIRIVNDMDDGMERLKQQMTQLEIVQAYARETGLGKCNEWVRKVGDQFHYYQH